MSSSKWLGPLEERSVRTPFITVQHTRQILARTTRGFHSLFSPHRKVRGASAPAKSLNLSALLGTSLNLFHGPVSGVYCESGLKAVAWPHLIVSHLSRVRFYIPIITRIAGRTKMDMDVDMDIPSSVSAFVIHDHPSTSSHRFELTHPPFPSLSRTPTNTPYSFLDIGWTSP